jgi:hypothetical protein
MNRRSLGLKLEKATSGLNALSSNTTTRSLILRQKQTSPSDSLFGQMAVCYVRIRSGPVSTPLVLARFEAKICERRITHAVYHSDRTAGSIPHRCTPLAAQPPSELLPQRRLGTCHRCSRVELEFNPIL